MTADDRVSDEWHRLDNIIEIYIEKYPKLSRSEIIYKIYKNSTTECNCGKHRGCIKCMYDKKEIIDLLIWARQYSDIIYCLKPTYISEIFNSDIDFTNPDDLYGNTGLPKHLYPLIEAAYSFNREIVFDYIHIEYKLFSIYIKFHGMCNIYNIKYINIIELFDKTFGRIPGHVQNNIFLTINPEKNFYGYEHYRTTEKIFDHIFKILESVIILNGTQWLN